MAKTIRINNRTIPYSVSRRDVKYPRLEFRTGDLLVILPKRIKNEQEILNKHSDWIYKKYIKIQQALEDMKKIRLNESLLNGEFKELIDNSVEENSKILGVELNKVVIRKMKSKWGSMSSNKNMTINSYMRMLPRGLVNYIVYHELAHLLEKKHNDKFWGIIKNKYKDYPMYENELFKYWFVIQNKLKY